MKEYLIYCDLHIGSPTEIRPKFIFTKYTAFLGDNFELKNILKSELKKIGRLRQEVMQKCRKNKGIYIPGNHSLEPLKQKFYQIQGGILFTHGDVIHDGFEKANLWRKKFKKGESKLYWYLLKVYRKIFPGNLILLNKKYIKNAYHLAKINNCHTIVMGHFHVKKRIDLNYQGIRIIFLPRGVNKIRL